jgi:uncharacterized protein
MRFVTGVTRFAVVALAAWLLPIASGAVAADPALANAAESNDAEAIRVLLATGGDVDVNAAQADGMTALHWASYNDDARTVKLLIGAGADANATNCFGVTPLSLACTNGSADVVKMMLEAGADASAALRGGETPLMIASRTGRLAAVEALLAHGAKVDARERKGQTALMWAAAEGHVDVVDALLEAGADLNVSLPSGFTPLLFAVREGREAAVLRLIDAGAEVNEPMTPRRRHDGDDDSDDRAITTALMLAVENGHFELARALLVAGADPNAHPAGVTALHLITSVRKPIRGDGNPPPRGSGALTSLDCVRDLVAHGANVNVRVEHGTSELGRFTTTGSTPFLMAARASDVPLMKLLLELGADPAVPNADNCSPLLAAAGVGALGDGDEAAGTEDEANEAVNLLLDRGADVNAVDDNGETAMHGAAYQSRPGLVQLLVKRGADIEVWNRKNKAGWTPWMIAQGHRPGNFRPAPHTIAAVELVMRAAGAQPPELSTDAANVGY